MEQFTWLHAKLKSTRIMNNVNVDDLASLTPTYRTVLFPSSGLIKGLCFIYINKVMKALVLSTAYSTSPVYLYLWLNQDTRMALCVCVCVCVCTRSVVSDSLQPHGLQPWTRLLGPWNFPGKNTGAGCHSSWSRDQTHMSCVGRQILYHCPPGKPILFSTLLFKIVTVFHGSNIKTQVWP